MNSSIMSQADSTVLNEVCQAVDHSPKQQQSSIQNVIIGFVPLSSQISPASVLPRAIYKMKP